MTEMVYNAEGKTKCEVTELQNLRLACCCCGLTRTLSEKGSIFSMNMHVICGVCGQWIKSGHPSFIESQIVNTEKTLLKIKHDPEI